MALRASALKGALVAAICVLLVVSWVGEPAQGSPSSCVIHRCISECPSKCDEQAANECKGVQDQDEAKCRYFCGRDCQADCDCDNHCKGPGSNYNGCHYSVSEQCKEKCEKECKGEKVES